MKLIIEKGLKDTLKPEIARLNQSLEDIAKQSDGFLGDLLSAVLINSGKRVRPALVILGSRLGNADPDKVRVVEMAVELIHIATLIHDDVIDKAALRRGRQTIANEHGIDTAVLLGDHVYTNAFQRVAELKSPEILGLLAHSTSVMCQGEIDQLKSRYQFQLSEKDYFSFIEKKTASLFGASIRSGAILASQNLIIQQALEKYGLHLGMAFQIVDDLLDITGNEAVVGKTLHTDLKNGKMTLPLIHYRDQIKADDQVSELMTILKNPNGHLNQLIRDMDQTGSIQYAEKMSHQHVQAALKSLDSIPNGDTKDQLVVLAEMLLQRKS